MIGRALPLLALLCAALPGRAEPLVRASLLAEPSAAAPGVPFTAAVRLQVAAGWHVYWRNPGDSGLPPRLRWSLPAGTTAGEIQWPVPHRVAQGPLVNHALEGDVWLLVEVTPGRALAPGAVLPLAVAADWLACQEECIPEKAALELHVSLAARPGPLGPEAAGFAAARERLPRRPGWRAALAPAPGDAVRLTVATGALPLPGASAAFFPAQEGLLLAAAPQTLEPLPDGFALTLARDPKAKGPLARLSGVVVLRGAQAHDEVAAEVEAALAVAAPTPSAPAALPAGLAVLFALLGGLLLNLMPCVLPVLGFKVMSFVRQGQDDPRRARLHGLAFGAGVLVSFWALAGALLALRASGAELGWGFQLQSPAVVSLLAFLFFALGLAFLGFVEVGAGVQTLAGAVRAGEGLWGSFASGALATAVATPCTAPFMGVALGAALVAPAWLGLAIFTALGAGMALPYVALSASPALLRRVPRPGPWMVVLQQALAFPLFGTVVWLLAVLFAQGGAERVLAALGGLVVIAFALWLRRLTSGPVAGALRRRAGGAVVALLLAAVALANTLGAPRAAPAAAAAPDAHALPWQEWSEERVARLKAEGRPVFVDFTAAWCITCQVNERVVFSSQEVRERFAALGVVPLRADWTRADPAITRALAAFGRSGVPLNVLHGPGGDQVLPSVLTPGLVLAALDRLTTKGVSP